MKKAFKYSIQGLALLCVFSLLAYLSSCKEEETSGEVALLSFGPSGVHHGDEIMFFGENLDKVTAVIFQPAVEVPKSAFNSVTSSKIFVTVPEAAQAGKVILKTSKGEVESQTILNFEVPVELTGITAEAKPGTDITITGQKLNWIESITFSSDLIVEKADFKTQTLTQLVVTVPMEAQTGFLIFATGGTKPLTFGSEDQLTVTKPVVTGISPASIRHTENLTITGTNLDLVTSITFTGDKTTSTFVSKTATEIVVAVPVGTTKGKLTLKQASPINVVSTDDLTIILPTASSVSPSPAKPGIDNLTITGQNLDLVASLKLPGSGSISTFISQSATQIVLAIPANAAQGAIDYVTVHGYQHALDGAILKLPASGAYPTLDKYIYKDGLQAGWQQYGGWGHTSQSYSNTDNPADGNTAIKTVFNDQWGAIQIHNNTGTANPFVGYNYLVFYVYVVGEDSDIIAQLSGSGDYYPPHFTKDKYHQIVVPLASLPGSSGSIGELIIKNNNPVNDQNTTVFVDEIGLSVGAPLGILPDLSVTIFGDALNGTNFGLGGGWGGSTTTANSSEQQRAGDVSVKAVFAGGGSGASQFGDWGRTTLSTAGMQYFSFSIFGGSGAGANINVNIKPNTTGAPAVTVNVTVDAGKWKDVKIPLSSFGSPATIGEIQFQDTGWAGTVFIDHVGLQQ